MRSCVSTRVIDEDRELAFANSEKAAQCYGVDMSEDDGLYWAGLPIPAGRRRTAGGRRALEQPLVGDDGCSKSNFQRCEAKAMVALHLGHRREKLVGFDGGKARAPT
jgi:hypothetical protein